MGESGPIPQGYLKALFEFAQKVGGDSQPQLSEGSSNVSAEDREWLTACLSDLVAQTDPVGLMRKYLQSLESIDLYAPKSPNEVERAMEALEGLCELVENVDDAGNFHKIGGFRLFPPLLRSSESALRRLALELMATAAQNHPYVQQSLYQADILPLLLELLDWDPSVGVRTKAVFAVSSLLGSVEASAMRPALAAFADLKGVSRLLSAAQKEDADERLRCKVIFCLSSLLRQGGEVAAVAEAASEEVLSTAADLFRNSSPAEEQLQSMALELMDLISVKTLSEKGKKVLKETLKSGTGDALQSSKEPHLQDSQALYAALLQRAH